MWVKPTRLLLFRATCPHSYMWQVRPQHSVQQISWKFAPSVLHFKYCTLPETRTKEQNPSPICRCWHSKLLFTSHLGSTPPLSSSQATHVLIKIFGFKLMAWPDTLKFHQCVCECTWINTQHKLWSRNGCRGPFKRALPPINHEGSAKYYCSACSM